MPNDDESVGYKNPPSNSRFRKGVSGNPRGRPKGSRNLATLMKRALREKVAVQENGKRKLITKSEAIVKQFVNKAASGDLRALTQLAKFQCLAEEFAVPKPIDTSNLESLTDEELEAIIRGHTITE